MLHCAPEPAVSRVVRPLAAGGYLTTDLRPDGVDVAADIQRLPFAAGDFGTAICSHVLEHVPDDRAALRELARVTARGGLVIVMVPLRRSMAVTDEDPSVTDPAERRRRFAQEDHVRLYGADVEARISACGLAPEPIVPTDLVAAGEARRLGVRAEDEILACRVE